MNHVRKAQWLFRYLKAGAIFSAIALSLGLLSPPGKFSDQVASSADAAWGSESIKVLHDGLAKLSPISLANACGMGASSCFKCHNGKRAVAPNHDPADAPWHVQHKKVNNSCAGCHDGNPRIMKKNMSHNGMRKAPRDGEEACGVCHQSDMAKVVAMYKSDNAGSM